MAQKPSGGQSGPSRSGKEKGKSQEPDSRDPDAVPSGQRAAATAVAENEAEPYKCHSGTGAGEGGTSSLCPPLERGGTSTKPGTETNVQEDLHKCCKEKDAHPLIGNQTEKQKRVRLEQDDESLPPTATYPDATSVPDSDDKCRTSPIGSRCTAEGQQPPSHDVCADNVHATCKLLPESSRGSHASPRRDQESSEPGGFKPITLSQFREALSVASSGRPTPASSQTCHQADLDAELLAKSIPFHLICLPSQQSHKVTRFVEASRDHDGFVTLPLVNRQDKSTSVLLSTPLSSMITSPTSEDGIVRTDVVAQAHPLGLTKGTKKIASDGKLKTKVTRWVEAGSSREDDLENALLLTEAATEHGQMTEVAVQLEEECGESGSPATGTAIGTLSMVKDAQGSTPTTLARKVKVTDALVTCGKLSITKVKALSSGWRSERVTEITSQPNVSCDPHPHSTSNGLSPFSSTASESMVGAGRTRESGSDSGSNGVAAIHLHVHDHLCAFSTSATCKAKLSGSRASEARGAEELTKSESSLLCRICQMGETESGEPVKKADCLCKGDLELIHRSCLVEWVRYKGNNTCELCRAQFSDVDPPVRTSSDLNRQQIMRNLLRHYSRMRPLSAKRRIMTALFLLFLTIMTTVMGILTKDADDNFRIKTSKRSLYEATETEQHQAYVRFAVCWSFLLFCATLASATLSFWLCVEVAYYYHRRQVYRLALQLTEQAPSTNHTFPLRPFF